MILTDKAEKDFNLWMFREHDDDFGIIEVEPRNLTISFWDIDDFLQNTVIIDWFDSVGIYINISHDFGGKFFYTIELGEQGEVVSSNFLEKSDSRLLATTAAITEANRIYNETYKYHENSRKNNSK